MSLLHPRLSHEEIDALYERHKHGHAIHDRTAALLQKIRDRGIDIDSTSRGTWDRFANYPEGVPDDSVIGGHNA